jgi:aspartate kinase
VFFCFISLFLLFYDFIFINIKMISTSEIKISCLVEKSDAKRSLKALHTVFDLDSDVVADVKGDLPPEA